MVLLKSRWNAACSTLGMSVVMGMFTLGLSETAFAQRLERAENL